MQAFFIKHLNIVYCAKSHLAERLSELVEQMESPTLMPAILKIAEEEERQIKRMDEIYNLLNAQPSMEGSADTINVMENAFTSIYHYRNDRILKEMATVFYVTSIKSMELASLQILLKVGALFCNDQIIQLLNEFCEKAKVGSAFVTY